MTTVAPARWWSSMMSSRSTAVHGSKPFVGSSRIRPVRHHGDAQLHLLLAARQLVEARPGVGGQVDTLEKVQRPGGRLRAGESFELAEVGHHVDDRLLLVEAALFWEVGQASVDGRVVGASLDAEASGRGGVDAEQRADRRRLARAVRAEQAERLAWANVEREAVDDRLVAEGHREVVDLDHRGGLHGSCLSGVADSSRATQGEALLADGRIGCRGRWWRADHPCRTPQTQISLLTVSQRAGVRDSVG